MIDRFVLSVVAQPVTESLGLTNTQMGMLLGAGFAILYSLSGVPIAHLIDKGNRKRIVACGVLFWSLMTAASAFTTEFTSLMICRAGVAIGEAVLTPAAISLIGDMFSRKDRALPTSCYMATSNIMATGSFLLGALVYDISSSQQMLPTMDPWRMTLLIVSLPGIILAGVVALTIREPARVNDNEDAPQSDSAAAVLRFLKNNARTFLPFFIGTGLISSLTLGIMSWAPTLLVRIHGLQASEASYIFGAFGMPASLLGTFTLPWLATRLQERGRHDAVMLVLMLCVLLPIPAIVHGMLSPHYWAMVLGLVMTMMFLPSVTVMTCLGLQLISPSRMRARNVALNLLVINLFGYTVGPFVSGFLADRVFSGPTAIASALAVMAAAIGPLTLLCYFLARKGFRNMVRSSAT
ncbi:MFS transporter [Pseudomonas aeruginosa]|nr:MFS transporter [Pseudomonas aeruginosa]MDG3749988.1 MFS transporter [Pseudomonas aeruginosa]MDG3793493.1 MFS transporter [Pseudomonas aeruginosa]